MGRHRLEPPPRVRPRYGRVAAAGLSLLVTLVALLGGLGLLPVQAVRGGGEVAVSSSTHHRAGGSDGSSAEGDRGDADPPARVAAPEAADPTGTALPAGSGEGRRVVFAKGAQRVWLVDPDGTVEATYLVSGSVTDNLRPGTYDVYSRSRWAVGVDDSGVMQYFVRFAHGPHAAIGFHSIPTKHGTPLQSETQLGTPQSHGCIRQRLSDARLMWDFARVGTDVVVVA
ncbi:L,D-transpeptidase [Nocardioides pocheonensis]|uniref:Murein L,D-transpeptidase n=1 Tax=Nocardioides pocheonensis TaxID=661485 RepID=A0A3N0GYS0_9ACTN|nr:L,D-transpeptidase [Nocardioides pocheonensis]RNM17551.1 murein L,D-transpeptidase [Nocardioides pocheonensis]